MDWCRHGGKNRERMDREMNKSKTVKRYRMERKIKGKGKGTWRFEMTGVGWKEGRGKKG